MASPARCSSASSPSLRAFDQRTRHLGYHHPLLVRSVAAWMKRDPAQGTQFVTHFHGEASGQFAFAGRDVQQGSTRAWMPRPCNIYWTRCAATPRTSILLSEGSYWPTSMLSKRRRGQTSLSQR